MATPLLRAKFAFAEVLEPSTHPYFVALFDAYNKEGAVCAMMLRSCAGGRLWLCVAVIRFDAASDRWQMVTPPCFVWVGGIVVGGGTVSVVGDGAFRDLRVRARMGSLDTPIGGVYMDW
jgi:hypothetical protein